MGGHKSRVLALQALVAGSAVALRPEYADIHREFQEVFEVRRTRNLNRRRLMQILHSSRALDTCIKTVILADGQNPTTGLGNALHRLERTGLNSTGMKLAGTLRHKHQRAVVSLRNDMLHVAGLFPMSDSTVETLLSDMDACLSDVLALT